MLELQKFLFEKEPNRKELVTYVPSEDNKLFRIQVYRNHSFELVEHTISAYLDYAKIRAEFIYSDYDDSLSFFHIDSSADLLILWLDMERYQMDNIQEFMDERLSVLVSIYKNPVLFIPFGEDVIYRNTNVICYDFSSIKEKLGKRCLDERMEKISGTRMSAKACMMIAKDIGLNYIPALVKPLLKAIVVDLDHTLYKGVLGEDGIEKIEVSESYLTLQRQIKNLGKQGFFLCIASKNEEKDVWDMFDKRKDFPLKKEKERK